MLLNHGGTIFINLTSGPAEIGIEFLGAKFGSRQSKTDIVLTGSFALLSPARINLNATRENIELGVIVAVVLALGAISISALMLIAFCWLA